MTDHQKRAALALRDQLTVMGQRDIPTNRDGFDDEFDSLRHLDHRTRQNRDEFYTALLGSNMSKNRYADVLPNEATRVILDPINVKGDGDYINANYIDGRRLFGVPFVYIATQAPMRSTVGDFWRMVYENNTAFIVMLCAEIEAGKQKSEKYWPEGQGGVLQLGPLSLVILSENHRADTIFRTILIRTVDGKERKVFHMQYVRWPDQGIPQSSAPLMEIIMALGRSPLSTQTPTVVHCSGGVGRSGVFIAMHVALALFQLERPVSVPHIVQYLKLCRTGMVQRKDQYLFTYYAILREMERMIWSSDQTARVDDLVQPQSGSNRHVPVPRRPSEHVPMHVAQFVGDIPRTSVAGTRPPSNSAPQPEHGIRATRHVPTRQVHSDEFGPSYESQSFEPEREVEGAAAANSIEEQLRQLQLRTKSMRNSNSAGATRGASARNSSGYFNNITSGFLNSHHYQQQPVRAEQQPPSSRATPPLQPQRLTLEDPGQQQAPAPGAQSLPPLSVVPQLNLGGQDNAAVLPPSEYRPIVPMRASATRSTEPVTSGDQPPARSSVGNPSAAVVHRGGDELFFSPEPSKPSAQHGESDGQASIVGGVARSSAADARSSDLFAAARDFNSALFAPLAGGGSGQNFTSTGRNSTVRKADVGLL
jgi:protein tyrosine phosphatase